MFFRGNKRGAVKAFARPPCGFGNTASADRKVMVKNMGLNSTPSSERVHIGFFGRRNAGKSSVVNAVTKQNLAVVSEIKGTTTDPVYKSMELLPLGPVMIIDTPGIDDEGALGEKRVEKARDVLKKTDIAILVIDSLEGEKPCDRELAELFRERNIEFITVYNKHDISHKDMTGKNTISVSAQTGYHIDELKEMIAHLVKTDDMTHKLVGDLLAPGDIAVLVVPIDSAAPKGRLILPQQQTIRDILESGAISVVTRETELSQTLASLGKKPKLVITDSQAFSAVNRDTPPDIKLTSFSILFARYKGSLADAVFGARAIDSLCDGDTVLISEGCTHHRQCDDIGTVKIPRWLKEYTGKNLRIETTSGTEFPKDLSGYKLCIHCGGCMLNEREMKYRIKACKLGGLPVTNYGIALAYMKGILERSIEIFPELGK